MYTLVFDPLGIPQSYNSSKFGFFVSILLEETQIRVAYWICKSGTGLCLRSYGFWLLFPDSSMQTTSASGLCCVPFMWELNLLIYDCEVWPV